MPEVKFNDIKLEETGRSNQNPLEITLFEGIGFNLVASSTFTAYGSDKKSDNPGKNPVVGYLIEKGKDYLDLTTERLTQSDSVSTLGGFRVYSDAIHSIRELQ